MKTRVLDINPTLLVSNFFHFSVIGKKKYLKSCKKVLKNITNYSLENSPFFYENFVLYTNKYWEKYQKSFISNERDNLDKEFFLSSFEKESIKEDLNLNIWLKFLQQSRLEESQIILWHRILKIEKNDIAKGLRVSIGTVDYRLSRGLKLLGEVSAKESDEGLL